MRIAADRMKHRPRAAYQHDRIAFVLRLGAK
jgi:hypothetical protein